MESFSIQNLSFCYPNSVGKALDDISFTVNSGEFVLICGKSGCGKTTLLRLFKPALSPFGEISGDIYFAEKPIETCGIKEQASSIGFVMQNPDSQIVCDKVWHELAFGLESLGVKTPEIRAKVSEMASFFGIESWFYKNVSELSGGQKQLLNLASVMVTDPSVLILDEPTSQLDPIAAEGFLNTLKKINRELGTTIILSEHRLEDAFPMADKVIVLDEGRIIADERPTKVSKILKDLNHDMYEALPTPIRVHGKVENSLPCPLTIRDGRLWLEEYSKTNTLNPDAILKDDLKENSDIVIEVKDAYFRYEKNLPDTIKGINLSIKKGEIFSILGGNGAGKTTALSLISGLNTPYRGSILINGQNISKIKNPYSGVLGVLPQNPQSVFLKNTVYLDLEEVLSESNLQIEEKSQKIKNIVSLLNLESLLKSHPYDLSGGEQQRAALAKVLLKEPQILLLDEPTKGMDAHFKEEFGDILTALKSNGVTIVMVSHDIEFCAKTSDRCALLFDGSVTSTEDPREFFKGKNFYTTAANRMARTFLPDAVLAEDIILACGGSVKKREKPTPSTPSKSFESEVKLQKNASPKVIKPSKPDRHLTKRTLMATFLILFLIPLTIYTGIRFFGDRKYYLTSLLIIFETMIPFLMVFESRKPMPRELVIISVLCALTAVGRAAFFMLPEFKPTLALVIVAGVCFGGEAGFLVGSTAAFVSNFFFGQGPWTPWQMFALGIIGFIAGILFKKGFLKKTKVSLSIFGFFVTFIIYGGIMNPVSVIMTQTNPTFEMLIASYISGVPLDFVHALATWFFLWFISEPMIEKLERVKLKFGLI